MADVPDGRHRPDAGPGASLPLRAGEDSVRDRPLHQRGQAPLRRARQAARRTTPTSPATTRSPTSRPGPGCACRSARASSIADYPNVKRWFDAIAARPAVERGLKRAERQVRNAPMDAKAKEILFGADAIPAALTTRDRPRRPRSRHPRGPGAGRDRSGHRRARAARAQLHDLRARPRLQAAGPAGATAARDNPTFDQRRGAAGGARGRRRRAAVRLRHGGGHRACSRR